MSLLDFLKAAAGEVSLTSPLGIWMQNVSAQVDAAAAGGFDDYLQVKRVGSTQAAVGAGTKLLLNGIVAQSGIPYDTANALATLTPGKTYRLSAHGCFNNFSPSVATGGLQIQWADDTNTVLSNPTGDCPKSNHVDPQSTGGQSEEPTTEIIWTCPIGATQAQRSVKLRCTTASGTADLLANFYTATIVEISTGV